MQEPSVYSTAILAGLGADSLYPSRHSKRNMGIWVGVRHVYGGTVSQATIDKRRAKNRVARKSRRVNRLRGVR